MSNPQQGDNSANITTATTTTVKSGPGTLKRITFNKLVASEVYTLYDNTAGSGTKIGTITFPGTLLDSAKTLEYNVKFSIGLTIVSAQASDATVVWNDS